MHFWKWLLHILSGATDTSPQLGDCKPEEKAGRESRDAYFHHSHSINCPMRHLLLKLRIGVNNLLKPHASGSAPLARMPKVLAPTGATGSPSRAHPSSRPPCWSNTS